MAPGMLLLGEPRILVHVEELAPDVPSRPLTMAGVSPGLS